MRRKVLFHNGLSMKPLGFVIFNKIIDYNLSYIDIGYLKVMMSG